MISIVCCDLSCGVVFGMPEHVYEQSRQKSDRWFHCPNGHRQHYAESEADRLRKKVEDLEASLTRWRETTEREEKRTASALRQAAYWKGIAHRKGRQ